MNNKAIIENIRQQLNAALNDLESTLEHNHVIIETMDIEDCGLVITVTNEYNKYLSKLPNRRISPIDEEPKYEYYIPLL